MILLVRADPFLGGVPTTPDLMLLQKYRNANGSRIVIHMGAA